MEPKSFQNAFSFIYTALGTEAAVKGKHNYTCLSMMWFWQGGEFCVETQGSLSVNFRETVGFMSKLGGCLETRAVVYVWGMLGKYLLLFKLNLHLFEPNTTLYIVDSIDILQSVCSLGIETMTFTLLTIWAVFGQFHANVNRRMKNHVFTKGFHHAETTTTTKHSFQKSDCHIHNGPFIINLL